MEALQISQQVAQLPPHLQAQVADYIAFLLERYKTEAQQEALSDFAQSWKEMKNGDLHSIESLWEGIDDGA